MRIEIFDVTIHIKCYIDQTISPCLHGKFGSSQMDYKGNSIVTDARRWSHHGDMGNLEVHKWPHF